MSGDAQKALAADLVASLRCDDRDEWFDDLSSWDSMRGFDCNGADDAAFVRVYGHQASVAQTLSDWDGTIGRDRSLVYGPNWYVIGPPNLLGAVASRSDATRVDDGTLPAPLQSSPKENYLSTCARFVGTEGVRYVQHPRTKSSSQPDQERLFPGVTRVLHQAIDGLPGQADMRATDEERLLAEVSVVGPKAKAACGDAWNQVGKDVASVDGTG